MNLTEKSIIGALNARFPRQNVEYKLENSFVFKWESDFFLIQKASGYSYEIEIKISRADFRKDAEKEMKHQILKSGSYPKYIGVWDRELKKFIQIFDKQVECNFRPNKFFYCVPDGLITVDMLPPYAGLMYVNSETLEVKTVKEAPFIHKEKLNFHPVLLPKYYNKFMDARHELHHYKREHEKLTKLLNEK